MSASRFIPDEDRPLKRFWMPALLAVLLAGPAMNVSEAAEPPARKPDRAATKLLADARAARAVWADFPGFKAWSTRRRSCFRLPMSSTPG